MDHFISPHLVCLRQVQCVLHFEVEDLYSNVPLMGMSIDVFHFMGKNKSGFVGNRHPYFPQTLSGFATFTCINDVRLATQRSHFSALKKLFPPLLK
jgi:hypothetical protein